MRELLRSKARAAMKRKGYTRLNKPQYGIDPSTGLSGKLNSLFAMRWRDFI